jgi:hypothetical protein
MKVFSALKCTQRKKGEEWKREREEERNLKLDDCHSIILGTELK